MSDQLRSAKAQLDLACARQVRHFIVHMLRAG